jgi:putative nucleotidyltransferase with HDIG domain
MIDRNEALSMLNKYAKNNLLLLKRSLAIEQIMKTLSHQFDEDEQVWSLTALLHDLDHEYTQRNPENHTLITSELLEGLVPQELIDAIKSHNYVHTGVIPTNMLDKALLASDAVVELIFALSKDNPIENITTEELISTYQNPEMDATYPKHWLLLCSDLNINLKDFFSLSLKSIKEITPTLENI